MHRSRFGVLSTLVLVSCALVLSVCDTDTATAQVCIGCVPMQSTGFFATGNTGPYSSYSIRYGSSGSSRNGLFARIRNNRQERIAYRRSKQSGYGSSGSTANNQQQMAYVIAMPASSPQSYGSFGSSPYSSGGSFGTNGSIESRSKEATQERASESVEANADGLSLQSVEDAIDWHLQESIELAKQAQEHLHKADQAHIQSKEHLEKGKALAAKHRSKLDALEDTITKLDELSNNKLTRSIVVANLN